MTLSDQSIERIVAFNLDALMNRTTGCLQQFAKVVLNLGAILTLKKYTLRAHGRGRYVEWFSIPIRVGTSQPLGL